MSTKALLSENPKPNISEVKEALSGHICRCGCYSGIKQAVLHAGEKIEARGKIMNKNKHFKPRVDRKFIGKYRPRLDGPEKAACR